MSKKDFIDKFINQLDWFLCGIVWIIMPFVLRFGKNYCIACLCIGGAFVVLSSMIIIVNYHNYRKMKKAEKKKLSVKN